nr:DUF411 domain-containing protein [uncultured Campylobacter sp.]
MKKILFVGALLAALGSYVSASEHVKVYHGESCGCCHNWAKYMEQNGFEVEMISLADEPLIQKKNELGLPLELSSCHTAIINGYVVEGHMPVGEIRTLLKNKPKDVIGIAVPGMPLEAPGMEQGSQPEVYDVVAFKKDGSYQSIATYKGKEKIK